ncbi:sulfotransferase domain-containing protein [Roseomonas sp. CAU 1739]|uniref:sulfotransferase domain-containing protein n=1 Tax=Roseomonas sp. CAU 1739 TaxID=3140364 RepID=UPI00325AEE57
MSDTADIAAAGPAPVSKAGEKLAFIHIPKTAGTSFTRALVAGWPRTRIIGTTEEFKTISPKEVETLDLIAGHFFAYQMDTPKWAAYRGLTVLRNPRAKLMSSYRYARTMVLQHGIAGTPQMRFAARASFAEYAFSIHGVRDRHSQIYNLGSVAGENPHDVPLAELLARAKARLDRIEVGTADRLQDYVDYLFRQYGKGEAPTLERLNTAEDLEEVDFELAAWEDTALRELMRPDEELFAYARALFAERAGVSDPGTATLGVPPHDAEAEAEAATEAGAAEVADSAPRMLVGTFHKTGTILMLTVLRRIAAHLGYQLWVPNRNPPPETWDIMFHAHSTFSSELLEKPHRGAVVIRDPRDIIISGAFYHARTDSDRDPWLYEPNARFGGRSYHEAIAALPTDAEKFIFEMDNFGTRTIANMRRYLDLSPDFIRVRFEDLTTDVELAEFRRMFTWLGIREADIDKALRIAQRSSLFSGEVSTKHVRSGKPAQWRQHFTPELHAEFHKRFGDVAEQLGYPAA